MRDSLSERLVLPYSPSPSLHPHFQQEGVRPTKSSVLTALQMAWPSLQGRSIISGPLCPAARNEDEKNTRQITEHKLLILISIWKCFQWQVLLKCCSWQLDPCAWKLAYVQIQQRWLWTGHSAPNIEFDNVVIETAGYNWENTSFWVRGAEFWYQLNHPLTKFFLRASVFSFIK